MSLEEHKPSNTCGVSIPHVIMSAILLLVTAGNNQVKKWTVLVWHKMHTKNEIPQIIVSLK
jgi:hypothetical protein